MGNSTTTERKEGAVSLASLPLLGEHSFPLQAQPLSAATLRYALLATPPSPPHPSLPFFTSSVRSPLPQPQARATAHPLLMKENKNLRMRIVGTLHPPSLPILHRYQKEGGGGGKRNNTSPLPAPPLLRRRSIQRLRRCEAFFLSPTTFLSARAEFSQ